MPQPEWVNAPTRFHLLLKWGSPTSHVCQASELIADSFTTVRYLNQIFTFGFPFSISYPSLSSLYLPHFPTVMK